MDQWLPESVPIQWQLPFATTESERECITVLLRKLAAMPLQGAQHIALNLKRDVYSRLSLFDVIRQYNWCLKLIGFLKPLQNRESIFAAPVLWDDWLREFAQLFDWKIPTPQWQAR